MLVASTSKHTRPTYTCTQGLGHTLRSLASLLQPHQASKTRPVPPGFMEAFMRRVDATVEGMGYSDAVQIAGGEREASGGGQRGESDSDIMLIGLLPTIFNLSIRRPLQAEPRGLPCLPPGPPPPAHRVRLYLPTYRLSYIPCTHKQQTHHRPTQHHARMCSESSPPIAPRSGGKKGGRRRQEGCVELLHANELAVVLNFLTRANGNSNGDSGPQRPIPATLLARLMVCITGLQQLTDAE